MDTKKKFEAHRFHEALEKAIAEGFNAGVMQATGGVIPSNRWTETDSPNFVYLTAFTMGQSVTTRHLEAIRSLETRHAEALNTAGQPGREPLAFLEVDTDSSAEITRKFNQIMDRLNDIGAGIALNPPAQTALPPLPNPGPTTKPKTIKPRTTTPEA